MRKVKGATERDIGLLTGAWRGRLRGGTRCGLPVRPRAFGSTVLVVGAMTNSGPGVEGVKPRYATDAGQGAATPRSPRLPPSH